MMEEIKGAQKFLQEKKWDYTDWHRTQLAGGA